MICIVDFAETSIPIADTHREPGGRSARENPLRTILKTVLQSTSQVCRVVDVEQALLGMPCKDLPEQNAYWDPSGGKDHPSRLSLYII